MDERDFLLKKQASWNQLLQIVDRCRASRGVHKLSREELEMLGPLYRRAASDLAYARAHAISEPLIVYLNNLVGRAHALLYQTESAGWRGIIEFLRWGFPALVRRRIGYVLVAFGITILSAIFAAALIQHDPRNLDFFVGGDPRRWLHYWKTGHVTHRISNAQGEAMSLLIMTNNIYVSIMAFLGGITGALFTVYMLYQNGAMLGAYVLEISKAHQNLTFWPAILPHGIIELTSIFIAGGAGLLLGQAILMPGEYRRRDAIAMRGREAVQMALGVIPLLVIAGTIEGFLSHSTLSAPFRLIFAVITAVALYSYLFRSPDIEVARHCKNKS